jgi:hypothetical protein
MEKVCNILCDEGLLKGDCFTYAVRVQMWPSVLQWLLGPGILPKKNGVSLIKLQEASCLYDGRVAKQSLHQKDTSLIREGGSIVV